jgi:polyisoprenoid-binding protein YceI
MFIPFIVAALMVMQPIRPDASRVWIEGSSNVADWACRATKFDARIDRGQVSVRVETRDLRCGNRKMDHDLYAALGASDPAAQSYILALFESRSDLPAGRTAGRLSVAGVERQVAAEVVADQRPDGSWHAVGSVPLRMTDFGVSPPVGLFGLIRSRNEVVVKFDLVIPPT